MIQSGPQYLYRNRLNTVALAGSILALTALMLLIVVDAGGNTVGLPLAVAALLFVAGLTAWLWQDPVRGLYVLAVATVVQEAQLPATVYPDDIGANIPFFEDMATWTHVKGLSFSLAELFMALVLLVWILKAIARRGPAFDRGSLMRPLGLYMVTVLFAEFHGVLSGGNFKVSLWELRPQTYMFVAYLLTCNLVKRRSQVWTLVWILVAGTGLKAIQGVYRARVTLGGNLTGIESLFPHEQSYFFNLVIVFGFIALLYGAPSRRMKALLWLIVPLAFYADLANQRRVATLALIVALLALLVITAFAHPQGRRTAVWILLALAVVFPPYYVVYQNKSGTLAEPARAVASNFHPDPRDASSNLYRKREDLDIMATVKSSVTTAVVGYGFGKPMDTPYQLANISGYYVFWNIMPHDSILWIWMRMGTIGYVLFWFLIGGAIVQAMRLMRRLRDTRLRGLALFIALAIIQEIIFAYLDLQWVNYRNLIFMGILFALLSRLAAFANESPPSADKKTRTLGERRSIPPGESRARIHAVATAPRP